MPTKEQIEFEAAQVDLEMKKVLLKKARQDVAEFENKVSNREETMRAKGAALKSQSESRRKFQEICNHHEGGKGLKALQTGQGQDVNYCVWKHKLPTGDTMIRCSRCGKTWIPPLEDDYVVDGKLDKAKFRAALDEYNRAYNFPTRYETGSSNQISWMRNGKPVNREKTHIFAKSAKEFAL